MNLVLFTCWRWRHGSCSYPALTIVYSLPCTTGLQWLHYRLCSCWMLTMLVSCLHCCLCSTTTYIALLVFCDLCSACLYALFYNYIVLLIFYDLCSTLPCLPSTFQCSTSLCLSPFQLTLVTPFTSCTLYHLPWSSGEPSLKTQRATS